MERVARRFAAELIKKPLHRNRASDALDHRREVAGGMTNQTIATAKNAASNAIIQGHRAAGMVSLYRR